jgi:formate hydrogenlyase subunit 3/multisubunit Na+/H+ antiporter MnhD subunit
MEILVIGVLAALVVVILFLPNRGSERVAKTAAVIVIAAVVVALLIRLLIVGVQLAMDLWKGRDLQLLAKTTPVVDTDHSAMGVSLIAAIVLAMGVEAWRWWRHRDSTDELSSGSGRSST